MDHDLDLASPDFDLLDNLRSYLHGPTSPDETSEYDVRLDQPVEDTSSSEVSAVRFTSYLFVVINLIRRS